MIFQNNKVIFKILFHTRYKGIKGVNLKIIYPPGFKRTYNYKISIDGNLKNVLEENKNDRIIFI